MLAPLEAYLTLAVYKNSECAFGNQKQCVQNALLFWVDVTPGTPRVVLNQLEMEILGRMG